MLLGQFKYSVDTKGRLFIPAKLREEMGEEIVISRSFDKCINVYSKDMWANFLEKFNSLPMMQAREFKRFLCSLAFEATADAQGRIVVPAQLREYAGLEKDVTIIGVDDHAEIWEPETYDAYSANIDDSERIAKLMELGF